MYFNKVYLSWVRSAYGQDYFCLEASFCLAGVEGKHYYAWLAEAFSAQTPGKRWIEFTEAAKKKELPEPRFWHNSAEYIYLRNPTYASETLSDCKLYINGIFPKLEATCSQEGETMEIKMSALDRYMVIGWNYPERATNIAYFDNYLDGVHCIRKRLDWQHASIFERVSIQRDGETILGIYKEIHMPEED